MSCALTTGFTLDCRQSNGGIEAVYFTEIANKATLTAASGVITAFTLAATKKFFKYELRKKTGQLEQNIQVNNENGTVFYEQTLTVKLDKLEVNKRNEILLLAKNNLMVIVKDNNGKYWLVGETRGALLSAGKGTTGTAFGDMSGFELTFTGEEPELAKEVDSTLIATLTA
ncbi:MAG: hypothetical protein F9K23_06995 [Bacteroidetes bacterium]|nr:MAG: hypothetical protein F9K23_06995 [Bacteroidota bacterium]